MKENDSIFILLMCYLAKGEFKLPDCGEKKNNIK